MKIIIDTDQQSITQLDERGEARFPLYSRQGFDLLSEQWSKVAWNQKYTYTFSWMGRPIIQLPEDMIRMQEVIYDVRPDVIVETGIAHGGSLVFYASLCRAMDHGRVIGVDIEIRPHNRVALEQHELTSLIGLVEGDSVSPEIVDTVRSLIRPGESVLVVLDARHTRDHVWQELEAYHSLVTVGSYLVATDGIMRDLWDVPRGRAEWRHDNPAEAVASFLETHPDWRLQTPRWPFSESDLIRGVTHWPNAWLRRIA